MNRKRINVISIVFACVLFTACSNDNDTNPDLYLEIPDNRFETLLIEKGIDTDGIVNQQMLKEDAKGVTRLGLEFVGNENTIKDLTGIEGFEDLTYLAAVNHDITQIELSTNVKLDTLYLAGNYIQSIDISNNSNLILLNITANELTSITGHSDAMHLKTLDVSSNNLETFSIQNESINVIFIGYNLLETLDTNGSVNLKNLSLTSNSITSIDLSSNKLLETLKLSDNNVETINLEQNTRLTHLFISSNSLTNLDLSSNQDLIELHVDRNPNLTCIKTASDQQIPYVTKSEYQVVGTCN